jgi:hypothetical protein
MAADLGFYVIKARRQILPESALRELTQQFGIADMVQGIESDHIARVKKASVHSNASSTLLNPLSAGITIQPTPSSRKQSATLLLTPSATRTEIKPCMSSENVRANSAPLSAGSPLPYRRIHAGHFNGLPLVIFIS